MAWLPDEATVDPRLLIDAPSLAAKKRGVEIFSGSCGLGLSSAAKWHAPALWPAAKNSFAKHVVIAAGSFCAGIDEPRPAPRSIYRVTRPRTRCAARCSPALDHSAGSKKFCARQHGYIVPRADGRIIAGSTLENVGFVRKQHQEGLRQIFDAAVALAPALAGAEIVEQLGRASSGLARSTADYRADGYSRFVDRHRALPERNPARAGDCKINL